VYSYSYAQSFHRGHPLPCHTTAVRFATQLMVRWDTVD